MMYPIVSLISLFSFISFFILYGLHGVDRKSAPLLVGDVHGNPFLVFQAIIKAWLLRRPVWFLGDLIDGPWPKYIEALVVKWVRLCPWADTIMGNHEAYSVFSDTPQEMARYWGDDKDIITRSYRPWREWMRIKNCLNDKDLAWLKSRPLYIGGEGWIACHAKPLDVLPPMYVEGKPSKAQIELFDNTKAFFKNPEVYQGSYGYAYVGHTRLSKLGGQVHHSLTTVLDWDAKKGGVAAYCIPLETLPKPLGGFRKWVWGVLYVLCFATAFLVGSNTVNVESTNWRGLTVDQQIAHLKWDAPAFNTKGSVLSFQAFSKDEIKHLIKAMDKYLWKESVGNTKYYRWKGKEERLEEIASTFLQVWGGESWEYQLLALAIAAKESGIGFTRKWKGDWYESDAGACGLTQVLPDWEWDCAELMDIHTSWIAQHWWMHNVWYKNDGKTPVVKYQDWLGSWKKGRPWVYRYNGGGKKAWKYGRKVMQYFEILKKISKGGER